MRFLILIGLLLSLQAQAGFIEVSATGSLRESNLDEDNNSKTRSITGSIAYYFFENSAIELSYTEGFQETKGVAFIGSTRTPFEQVVNFNMIGVDFILSGGGKDAVLKPYVKVGGAHQVKEVEFQLEGSDKFEDKSDGTYLTYGLGFKLQLSKNWSIKAGYDGYKGPIDSDKNEKEQNDSSFRAGISFIF